MLIKTYLFAIFSALSVSSAFFVTWAKNPVFSVLFLMLSFFNVSALAFLFDFEFLPIIFLIVYVGAVAVLFLFVLMMLNIKLAELLGTNLVTTLTGFIFSAFMIYQLLFLLCFDSESIEAMDQVSTMFLSDFTNISINHNFLNLFNTFTNIKQIAFALFTQFLTHFLLAGMVLLLAMMAVIVLTLQKQFLSKNQVAYNQVMKDFNFGISAIK